MIEDVYNVLARINEIKTRFGLNRPKETVKSDSIGNFDRMTNEAETLLNKGFGIYGDGDNSKSNINKIVNYYSGKNGVPASLVRSVIKAESDYNPDAVSKKGAMGLMQLMPDTAVELGVENPLNPEENIKGGVKHLKGLLDSYNGDQKLALAAYNSGKGKVDKAGGIPNIKETREYVRKVIDLYKKESGE